MQPAAQGTPNGRSAMQEPAAQKPLGLQIALHTPLQVEKQAPLPLHVYSPHSFSGSVPGGRDEHLPVKPGRLQARQVPPHAVLQQ